MSSIQQDLSIFNKFNFDRPPVGVRYLSNKPDGIERLDKTLDFCEMLKEAQLLILWHIQQSDEMFTPSHII
jgi:uncharacterized protein (DUF169 family)